MSEENYFFLLNPFISEKSQNYFFLLIKAKTFKRKKTVHLKQLVLLQLLSNLFKIHGFRNPSLKFQGFVRTHAKAATPPYFMKMNEKAAVAQL